MRVGTWSSRSLRRVLADERGFTLIELISAVLVTTLGVVALITTLDSSRHLITFAEKKEAAVHVGEQELERIQSLPYDQIELAAYPKPCPNGGDVCDLNNPARYLKGNWYRWDQVPRGEFCDANGLPKLSCERLIVDDTTTDLDPPASPDLIPVERQEITENGPSGGIRLRIEIQRFLTWVDDDCVKEPPNALGCTNTAPGDYKRITVAVRIVGLATGDREGLENTGPGRPILLSTTVRPPS